MMQAKMAKRRLVSEELKVPWQDVRLVLGTGQWAEEMPHYIDVRTRTGEEWDRVFARAQELGWKPHNYNRGEWLHLMMDSVR